MSRITKFEPSPNSKFPYKLKDDSLATELDCIHKLGNLEDLEEEIGISLETILNYIKNGYTDKTGKYHKQCYLTYVDNEWCICDLITDEYFLLKEAFKDE